LTPATRLRDGKAMADSLQTLLVKRRFIMAPGVFDLISARLADRTDVPALYMSGFGTVASYKGLPDAGLATYGDMVERVAAIAGSVHKPLIADGDTGYGGLLNVRHTVRGYEKAGAAAIQLEDQQIPKKCGHTAGRQVVATSAMVNKLRVAADARSSKEFLIVARTDALSSLGLDEALRRAEAYIKAGADIIFVESPETIDQMKAIGSAFDVPLLTNQVHGGRTPILPPDQLQALGFSIAIYPVTALLAASQAMSRVYEALARHEGINTPLYSFETFNQMMGFEDVWAFERRYKEMLDDQG
jgi:2-methylisocitrate lyase-like PEP mutase family enzyme